MLKSFIFFAIVTLSILNVSAQEIFSFSSEQNFQQNAVRDIIPQHYKTLTSNFLSAKNIIAKAPLENSVDAITNPLIIELPTPDGKFEKFSVVNTHIMANELAAQFPNIMTFGAQGVDNKLLHAKIDFTEFGFHAMIFSSTGTYFIDPYSRANKNEYICYYKKDYFNKSKANFNEEGVITDVIENEINNGRAKAGICIGSQLRTYRLAIACTGEYAQAVGGTTVALTLSAIVTTVNRVDGVYETEVAIRLVLIGTETNVIFINPSTDPFTGNNSSTTLIGESQTVINANIGSANYDIGHTFSTGGGGLANLGCVCSTNNKARGITGNSNPIGDPYDIDYVAHEIGHQFGANHTFNSGLGSCSGNRSTNNAYEVGSGTTIMAYAGICGNDNIQPHSDPFFHTSSFDAIVAYSNTSTGNTCASTTSTNNNPPTITMMPTSGKTIPKQTPFFLTGAATDIDGDAITYCWEEMDKGSSTTWDGGKSTTTAPLFKSRVPTVSPTRYIPSLANIAAGFPTNPSNAMGGNKGEVLPTVGRTMNFRLTVRDNKNGGGGVATGGNGCSVTTAFALNVTMAAGPFSLFTPNGAEVWTGGTTENISWDVANTNASPVGCGFVDVLMSVDGGLTFDSIVATHIPNTGSASITVPNIQTNTTVKFLIRCSDNYFFDISDDNFTINFNPNPSNGINKLVAKHSLITFPNPTKNYIQLNGISYSSNSEFEIINTLGQVIKQGKIELTIAGKAYPINVSELNYGIYFIQVKTDSNNFSAKFIKE
ncbi:MAG: hypothetical protein RL065_1738 [Bacteroidota bacterium]|jgi:hypothetical protein